MRFSLALAALLGAALALLAEAIAAPPVRAQDCATETPKDDIRGPEAQALYDCISDSLYKSFQGSGVKEAAEYRDWSYASTSPYLSATHGSRFVVNLINDIGKKAYLDFLDQGLKMPVGTIAAKESFTIDRTGKVKRGPLFFMEKAERGALPDTNDWKYTLILPNGKVMGVTGTETGVKVKFCHDCHAAVADTQDSMLYLPEEYRVQR